MDRRDCRTLGPLPLRAGTILGAKLAALGTFLLVLSVPLTLLGGLTFPIIMHAGWRSAVRLAAATMAGHVVATLAAAWFAFFTLLAVQSLLQCMPGRRARPPARRRRPARRHPWPRRGAADAAVHRLEHRGAETGVGRHRGLRAADVVRGDVPGDRGPGRCRVGPARGARVAGAAGVGARGCRRQPAGLSTGARKHARERRDDRRREVAHRPPHRPRVAPDRERLRGARLLLVLRADHPAQSLASARDGGMPRRGARARDGDARCRHDGARWRGTSADAGVACPGDAVGRARHRAGRYPGGGSRAGRAARELGAAHARDRPATALDGRIPQRGFRRRRRAGRGADGRRHGLAVRLAHDLDAVAGRVPLRRRRASRRCSSGSGACPSRARPSRRWETPGFAGP